MKRRAVEARGFSLIELLIVVAVLTILAAMAIPMYDSAKAAAGDGTAQADLKHAMTAIEFYMVRLGNYPSASSDLSIVGFSLSPRVTFTEFKLETTSEGLPTVHMHVEHADSSNAWHANYPKEGTKIEIRKPKK